MNDCLQTRYNVRRVPGEPVFLAPPLTPLWSFEGTGGTPLIKSGRSYSWVGDAEQEGFVCVSGSGEELWRFPARVYALGRDGAVAIRSDATGPVELVVVDPNNGRLIKSVACSHQVTALQEDATHFVGSTTRKTRPDVFRKSVALASLSASVKTVWEVETIEDYTSPNPAKGYDFDVACNDDRVFVGRGDHLIALDLRTGKERWAVALREFGGGRDAGKWIPMVAEDKVVIGAGRGVGAFDVQDGSLAWYFPEGGVKTVYGGRVYLTRTREETSYFVLDLRDGRVIAESPITELIRKKWGIKEFRPSTHMAVSETHTFLGDGRGRLYAFARDTGEAVWQHRPKDMAGGFSGNVPVIAGGRLYITTLAWPPAKPRLYCYQGS